jgi:hypothetical protein
MGHSRRDKQTTHERIVRVAAKRFRERGLEGIGVADVMKEAGVTVEKAWSRIEVQHLDGWVATFLRTQGYRPEVVYDEDNDCWQNALTEAPPESESRLPESFYRVEWESVVQAQNINTLDEYLAAPRIGRGTRLSREMKKKVWLVFQEYRAQLNESGKKEYVDLIRDARQFIENHCCPVKCRTESTGCRDRVILLGSLMLGVPVKWAFFQKA